MNLVLHLLNAVMVWKILERLQIKGAIFAGFLFALHPVHVESVAWVIERKDVLSGLFYLLAIDYYVKHYQRSQYTAYFAAILFFLLALLSKSMVVTLPCALLLIVWYREGKIKWIDVIKTVPFWVVGLIYSLADMQFSRSFDTTHFPFSMGERVILASKSLWLYLLKVLVPYPLMTFYPFWNLSVTSVMNWILVGGLGLLLVLALVLPRNRDNKGIFIGLLFFMLTLGPVLGFVDFSIMNITYVSDRFQYLASIGIIVIMAGFITAWKNTWSMHLQWGILIICGMLSFVQAGYYENTQKLMTHNLKFNQDAWMAHGAVGTAYMEKNDFPNAKYHLLEAIKRSPKYPEANANLGWILIQEGSYRESINYSQQAIQGRKNYIGAYLNWALALEKMGDWEAAVSKYHEILSLKPDDVDAYYNLAMLYEDRGELKAAEEYYLRAISADAYFDKAHNNLGVLLARQHRLPEAKQHFERAVQINPRSESAKNNLQRILKDLNQAK